ncbi:hypothetical protein Agub_g11386 [Astrephomene gubernaculifera]|uniref:Anti-silencing factor n=1 Tax=Astrephomene gubernaculifera TaxID=47775 RepID=A0AAD3DWF6_9CHLO|nr:hypothetical protein Agub_g11386 [Astrephomene gubernaculifera]
MTVNIIAVRALNNPAQYTDVISFEIEYEALTDLQEDLAWKIVYVGSADSDRYDQVLENVEVGPVARGTFKFVLEANPPNPQLIPADDIVGVTVILLTCSYREQEFIRVGYYVNNEYMDEELRENPPEQPRLDRLQRSILADHPRVTRFPIAFDAPEAPVGAQPMEEDPSNAMQAEGQPAAYSSAMPADPAPAQHFMEAQQGMMFDGHGQQPAPQQMYQYVPVQ